MAIKLKEVSSKRDLKSFIYFPFWLYKNTPFWVPPIIKDEKMAFNVRANPMFLTGDVKLFLVYKDRRIAGRVAVLASKAEIENHQKIRFGWLDFENDKDVSSLLFTAIEDAAREVNATSVEGPVGFTQTDRAGLLVDGFNEENSLASWYNFAYYQKHLEGWGYQKKQDWVEFLLPVPSKIPEPILTSAETANHKNGLRQVSINTKTELHTNLVSVLRLMSETPENAALFVPIHENQLEFYAEQVSAFLQPKNLVVLKDDLGEIAAFALAAPSLAKAAIATNGLLFPFGFLAFRNALQNNEKVEVRFFGVRENHQKQGISALLFKLLLVQFAASGVKTVASNPIKEEDAAQQLLWQNCEARQHKRRRLFVKILP